MSVFWGSNRCSLRGRPDEIQRILENDPYQLTNYKSGQAVTIALTDLNEWIHGNEDEPVGGFTMKVMMEPQKGK